MSSKGGGGGSGSQTVTQSSDPWGPSQTYFLDLMNRSKMLSNMPDQTTYFPESTVVPISQDTETSLNMIRDRAMQGSPLTDAAKSQAQNTIQGNYLDPSSNPWLAGTFNDAANQAKSQVNSAFSSAGRYGSGAHTGVLADKMNELATSIYGGNYQQERGRQTAMTALAPTLAANDYADANALSSVGNVREQQAGNELQDKINRFNYLENVPYMKLQQYSGLLNGLGGLGGTSTQTSPLYRTGSAAGILGGASTGSGIGSSLFSMFPETLGSIGLGASGASAAGGGLGALFSLFSDRRLKKDIKKIGKMDRSGLPIYSFKYKGDDAPRIGVMAQDVEKKIPQAVTHHPSGYKMVNYATIGAL
jgi:hypothetical protein